MRAAPWGGRDQGEEEARYPTRHSASATADVPARVYDSQLNRMESKLNSLFAAVASSVRAERPALPARPPSGKPQASLGAAIAEVTRRQKDLDEGRAAPRPMSVTGLQRDIVGLSAKLDDMRREYAGRHTETPACNLDKLRTEISTISEVLGGLASRGSVAALEQTIRALSQRIETSRSEGIREAVLQPLEQLVGELRHAVAGINSRTAFSGLESELQKLGAKLDGLGRAGLDPTALQKVQQQTGEICDLLTGALARPLPIERIERQIEELAQTVERQRSAAHEAAAYSFVDESAGGKIEERLDAIAAKVERAMSDAHGQGQIDALSRRIDELHRELADWITHAPPGADMRPLEDLVRALVDKLERTEGVDPRAINALEQRIAELAQRLDASSVSFSSLGSLEQTIDALFSELEKTRQAAVDAAQGSASRGASLAGADAVGQELQMLRAVQDEVDRRTAATLNAVHETLEKLVDRLSMVEQELSLRPKASNELLASGPAPVFAPAQRDIAGRALAEGDRADLKNLRIRPDDLPRRENARNAATPPASIEDFLIEPGSGFPGRREESVGEAPRGRQARGEREVPASRADFIAAARRAAQAAQMETAAPVAQSQTRTVPPPKNGAGLVRQTRNFVSQHRRPVVLSIAALFLAIGAYALVKTMVHAQSTSTSSADMPAVAMLASPTTAAPAPTATASLNAAATDANSARQPVSNADATPTAAIGTNDTAPDATQTDSQAAQGGDARAQFQMAMNYAEGRHVPRDLAAAARWYAKAAAQGLAPAQYRLAMFYEKGLGVTRDIGQARLWYQRAAEQGNIRAMHNFAVLVAGGGDDGKPDYATAALWFEKAAEYGVRDSQYNLGVLLARGLGVPQNFASAYTWFSIVAAQGDSDAASKRDDVGARLSDDQLAAAKAAADNFRPKTPDAAANDVQASISSWNSSSPTPAPMSKAQHAKVTML
jgi:localization factor PodJL